MGNTTGFSRPSRALFALILVAVATPIAASECPDLDSISFDSTAHAFTQERTLKSLPNPLISKGILQIREDSFVWQVCAPFDIRTVIDATGVSQSIEGGPATSPGAGAVQDAIQKINIADIFRGRFDRLANAFTLSSPADRVQGEPWRVTLTPQPGAIATVIAGIDVSGCQAIDQVAISYRDGGQDQIVVGAAVPEATNAQCPAE